MLAPAELDALAIGARDGDNDAFDRIVRSLGGELHIFISCRCAQAELCEELVQKTFVVAWQQLDRYQERGFLLAWLKGIARNLLREERRAQRRMPAMASDALERFIDERLDEQEGPESDESTRLLPRLDHCLQKLPQRSRDLLDKHHNQQIPLKTLAQHYKKKVGALAALLHRLRGKLKACVEAQA